MVAQLTSDAWVWRPAYDEVTAALHHEEFEVFELKCVLSTMFFNFASCSSLSLPAFPSTKFFRNCPRFLICISSLPSSTLCLVEIRSSLTSLSSKLREFLVRHFIVETIHITSQRRTRSLLCSCQLCNNI